MIALRPLNALPPRTHHREMPTHRSCGLRIRAGGYPFPFRDGSVLALFTSIGKGEYTIPDGTGPVLEALLRGILTVNYEQRFSIEQVVTHE